MLYTFQCLQHNSFPFFHADFPLHSYGSFYFFFLRKVYFYSKMMAHIGVQSSFFFQICSLWLGMCHQCHHEQDWTGHFHQAQCLSFLVPMTCDRDVSKTSGQVSLEQAMVHEPSHHHLALFLPGGRHPGLDMGFWAI